MKTRILILLLLSFLPASLLPAQAQGDDEAFFRQAAAGSCILYRGHQAYAYHIHYNGTYCWSDAEFKTGDVRYNGKLYHDIPLNVDAARQELLVRNAVGQGGKVLSREFVEWFTLGRPAVRQPAGAVRPEGPGGVLGGVV